MVKKEQKAEPKVCFRCKRIIEDSSNFYAFVELNNLRIVSTVYAHRKCWDEFLDQMSTLKHAQSMLGRMEGSLTSMGILKPKQQEVIIK